MSRSNRLSLAQSLLGGTLFIVVVALCDNLNAQQPFGGIPRYTKPTPLSNVINNHGEGPDTLAVTGDGLTIFWGGVLNGQPSKIWSATRSSLESEWNGVQAVGEDVFPGLRSMDPTVTSDGLEIVFRTSDVSLGYDSTHIDDRLVISTRESTTGPWSEPIDLPNSINDLTCVNHPSISGDGLELYFASTETCLGRNANIFVSKRASRGEEWSEPEMVEPLAWTPGVSKDGLELFFISGDRTHTDLLQGSFGPGSAFLKRRASRDDEFGTTIELNSPPNITQAAYGGVVGPSVTDDQTLYFTSSRNGVPQTWGAWQTKPAAACDINGDGVCDVDDVATDSLLAVNLIEGSELEPDVLKYDVSGDGRVDEVDLTTWLAEAATSNGLAGPYWRGDANLDGEFNTGDLTAVFQTAKYETDKDAGWAEGDWNGDGRFDTGDLAAAFQDGGYELGPRAALSAVPEPSSAILLAIGIIGTSRIRSAKRRKRMDEDGGVGI